jgi:hypothetical protein
MKEAIDSLIDRGAGGEREHHERGDEAPEIKLAAVAERVRRIRRAPRLHETVEQKQLIASIDA